MTDENLKKIIEFLKDGESFFIISKKTGISQQEIRKIYLDNIDEIKKELDNNKKDVQNIQKSVDRVMFYYMIFNNLKIAYDEIVNSIKSENTKIPTKLAYDKIVDLSNNIEIAYNKYEEEKEMEVSKLSSENKGELSLFQKFLKECQSKYQNV
jgi:hypothetical protein